MNSPLFDSLNQTEEGLDFANFSSNGSNFLKCDHYGIRCSPSLTARSGSTDGINQEIERLELDSSNQNFNCLSPVPEGHRAPEPEINCRNWLNALTPSSVDENNFLYEDDLDSISSDQSEPSSPISSDISENCNDHIPRRISKILTRQPPKNAERIKVMNEVEASNRCPAFREMLSNENYASNSFTDKVLLPSRCSAFLSVQKGNNKEDEGRTWSIDDLSRLSSSNQGHFDPSQD